MGPSQNYPSGYEVKEVDEMNEVKEKPHTEEAQQLKDEALQQKELAAFERFYTAAKKRLAEAGDKINTATFKNAMDKAASELKEAGDYSAQTIKRVTQALKKDIASSADKLGPNWDKLKDKSHHMFDIWRDRSTIFIGHASSAAGEWLHEKGDKLEHHTYHAGELTAGGHFKCTACGEQLELHKPDYLPPCSKCMASEYRRL